MIVLNGEQLLGLLPREEVIRVVEQALLAAQAGGIQAPARLHAHWGENTLLAMPAFNALHMGVKLVSVMPGNERRGLPVVGGVMVLSSAEDGRPLAVLDAAALTCQRTGAVAAVGIDRLVPADIDTAGLVGCGVQGAWQVIYAATVRPLRTVHCLVRSVAGFARFRQTVERFAPQVELRPCDDVRTLVRKSPLVIAATTASKPVLPDDAELLAGRHFVSVGSFRPDMQELPDAVYRLAGVVYVDTLRARREAGDLIHAVARGLVAEEGIVPITAATSARRAASAGATSCYKTVGDGAFDLGVATAFHAAAMERGLGQKVEW